MPESVYMGQLHFSLGWICQVHMGFGLSASAQVPDKPALAWVACPGILHRFWFVQDRFFPKGSHAYPRSAIFFYEVEFV